MHKPQYAGPRGREGLWTLGWRDLQTSERAGMFRTRPERAGLFHSGPSDLRGAPKAWCVGSFINDGLPYSNAVHAANDNVGPCTRGLPGVVGWSARGQFGSRDNGCNLSHLTNRTTDAFRRPATRLNPRNGR